MGEEHLRWLAANAKQTWFEADEIIFNDGDVASRLKGAAPAEVEG